jgi:mannose-6-phosphate isomerase-like protein (cupin superfamily)
VSPAYVFETEAEKPHDDAVLVAKSWRELSGLDIVPLTVEATYEAWASRAEAKRRLAKRKGVETPRLADDAVHSLPDLHHHAASEKTDIRLLVNGEHGGLAHCLLPAGKASSPVRHRTVEQLWHVIGGEGEIWRSRHGEDRVDKVRPGDSVRICVDTSFQFRAGEKDDLKLLFATMPPWPGPQEAVAVAGKWPISGAAQDKSAG